MLTPRGKSRALPEKFSSGKGRTHDTASGRTESPTHFQRAIPGRPELTDLLTYAHRSRWRHRPSTTPRHLTLFWAALVIPDQLVLAVSALLQCLASNCCEAGLSFSSPAGSRPELNCIELTLQCASRPTCWRRCR